MCAKRQLLRLKRYALNLQTHLDRRQCFSSLETESLEIGFNHHIICHAPVPAVNPRRLLEPSHVHQEDGVWINCAALITQNN